MKIANWNIERLKHIDKHEVMQSLCNDAGADFFVLTESDTRMGLNYKNCFQSEVLGTDDTFVRDSGIKYKDTERRISIYTDYNPVETYHTFDDRTALCVEFDTLEGNIIVYGVIIGVLGNRHPSFKADLDKIAEDIRRFAETGKPVCIAGDFNCSFGDKYYYTKYGRDTSKRAFEDAGIQILTENQPECIDHIALTSSLVKDKKVVVSE